MRLVGDRDEIAAIVHRYAELLDGGDVEGVVGLFSQATWRSAATGTVLRTPDELRAVYSSLVPTDGPIRTRHLMHNLVIELDDGADDATARCSYTVLRGRRPRRAGAHPARRPLRGPLPPWCRRLAPHRPALPRRPRRDSASVVVKFGFAVPAYGKAVDAGIAELVDAGEELGFDSAWWPDHIAVPEYATAVNLQTPFLEPLAACAWGLGRTSRLRFGTDVLVAPYRHPLAVAAMIGTMGVLAGDRLVLGVGIGYLRGEFEVLGADYDARAATTEEWVRALRETPDGFSVVQAPARVPVWIGGNNPRAHRRAALLGDGWHPLWLPPEEYAAARREILDIRRDAGLDAPVHVLVQCRPDALLRRARGRVAAGSAARARGLGVPVLARVLDGARRPTAPGRFARRPDR